MTSERQAARLAGGLYLRPPATVMRLARLGSSHQTRLSFMRVLLRRLRGEGWSFERPVWRINDKGVGVATYSAIGPARTYTLVAFAHDLPDHLRSDRVIAEAWDATFALFDGVPSECDLTRLAAQVPCQEAGRMLGSELVLSRANKSVRLFEHVVERLALGRQPDREEVESVGYLMRTTAVYGGGKFGVADRDVWASRSEFTGAFQPELLTVWLIRAFTVDLAEHLARTRAPATAVAMEADLRRRLGVGNATGLGMAPFLINHPLLLNNWVTARETALARVRALCSIGAAQRTALLDLVHAAQINASYWPCDHPVQGAKLDALRRDLSELRKALALVDPETPLSVDDLYRWAEENLGLEGQEMTVSLLLELHPDLVDDLAATMSADEERYFQVDGQMSVGALCELIEQSYRWALDIDFDSPAARARIWYVSAEKLEPRLGERFEEPLDAFEQALAPGRDVKGLQAALAPWPASASIASFLLQHPEHRHAVRRVQLSPHAPYAEIRDNTIDAAMLPIDMLRCKLAFFGATRFDPRSDRWIRITMYQGAPFPCELAARDPDRAYQTAARSDP